MRGQLIALQERLQLNIVHQTQLMQQAIQCKDKRLAAGLQLQIQQLAFEQQQLIQQIQAQQRHYLVQQGLTSSKSLLHQAHSVVDFYFQKCSKSFKNVQYNFNGVSKIFIRFI